MGPAGQYIKHQAYTGATLTSGVILKLRDLDMDIDAGLLLGAAPRPAEILHPASHSRQHQQGNESCTANILTDLTAPNLHFVSRGKH